MARLIASGFGLGFSPAAPGTLASFVACLLGAALLAQSRTALAIAAVIAIVAGLLTIVRAGGSDDPGWIVIDEVAGQWITLLALPTAAIAGVAIGFVVFRVLDIAKPGPIGWADRQPGAVGVMADDVLAGIIGAAAIWGLDQIIPRVMRWGVVWPTGS